MGISQKLAVSRVWRYIEGQYRGLTLIGFFGAFKDHNLFLPTIPNRPLYNWVSQSLSAECEVEIYTLSVLVNRSRFFSFHHLCTFSANGQEHVLRSSAGETSARAELVSLLTSFLARCWRAFTRCLPETSIHQGNSYHGGVVSHMIVRWTRWVVPNSYRYCSSELGSAFCYEPSSLQHHDFSSTYRNVNLILNRLYRGGQKNLV